MLAAILFDLDGTLVNTDPIHFRTWQELLRNYGIEMDHVFYKNHISGRLNPVIVADILSHLPPEEGQRVANEKEAYFRRIATELKPLPGLLDILTWVQECGLKTALVTNAPRENAEFMLRVLGLAGRFDTVILGEEAPAGKPDPTPYLMALNQLGVQASEVIAFEDSPSGIHSAVGAGIFTFGVASTHDPDYLRQAGASEVIADFTDSQLWQMLRRESDCQKNPIG